MAINGIAHSFEDINIILMGQKIGGIEGCNYDDTEDDPDAIYAPGSRQPVGMGLGQGKLVDLKLEMREDAFQAFAAPAKAANKSVRDYWPFAVVVSYADKMQDGVFIASQVNAINTDVIDKCKVVSVSKPNRRADKVLMRTLSLKGVRVR
jgi:hypothetical protein